MNNLLKPFEVQLSKIKDKNADDIMLFYTYRKNCLYEIVGKLVVPHKNIEKVVHDFYKKSEFIGFRLIDGLNIPRFLSKKEHDMFIKSCSGLKSDWVLF